MKYIEEMYTNVFKHAFNLGFVYELIIQNVYQKWETSYTKQIMLNKEYKHSNNANTNISIINLNFSTE